MIDLTQRETLLELIDFTRCANEGVTPEQAVDAYRATVLREAAGRQREWAAEQYESDRSDLGFTYDMLRGVRRAAKLIDPGTPDSGEQQ